MNTQGGGEKYDGGVNRKHGGARGVGFVELHKLKNG
jgi:hypothetical protein